MAEIKYQITKELGVLSESAKGWTKEINMVSWNDREPKFEVFNREQHGCHAEKQCTLSAVCD
jgi:hypothetical protein